MLLTKNLDRDVGTALNMLLVGWDPDALPVLLGLLRLSPVDQGLTNDTVDGQWMEANQLPTTYLVKHPASVRQIHPSDHITVHIGHLCGPSLPPVFSQIV